MTTLVLQAAGSAVGFAVGGPIGATIGGTLGALAGVLPVLMLRIRHGRRPPARRCLATGRDLLCLQEFLPFAAVRLLLD